MPTETGALPTPQVKASLACWPVYNEVTGFALNDTPLGRLHQLTVDTCGAQHTREDDTDPRPIRRAFSLVGLYLALEQGRSSDEVRAAHGAMGKPDLSWPSFPAPTRPWDMTVRRRRTRPDARFHRRPRRRHPGLGPICLGHMASPT